MRRWNGWGDEGFNLAMPEQGQDFLVLVFKMLKL